jgi:serine/threonine protein kinase
MDDRSTEDLTWLDATGDRFDEAWARGERPRIEEFLNGFTGGQRARLFRHLLRIELERKRNRNETPDRLDYEARFPGDIEVIRALLEQEPVLSGTTAPHPFPGEYCVLRFLGKGSFGEVWLARDLNLPRLVALKTLRVRAGSFAYEHALEALRNDAALLTQVRHPSVVQVYAWRQVGSAHYLLMQYVPGGSLSDLLKRVGPFDWRCAARYVADVGDGLLQVHARGIVHRDIKPANILWDPERDEALLTDFGVATLQVAEGGVAGTPAYMAPEAFTGHVSPALDVYSLAATMFQLVSGSVPFPATGTAEILEQVARGLPDSDPRVLALPRPLERLLRVGLAADPARRPGLREFISELRWTLNHLLADDLVMPRPAGDVRPLVDLRLVVRGVDANGTNKFLVSSSTGQRPESNRVSANIPLQPEQFRTTTGVRLHIHTVADRAGYLTVFNVGPTGNLNLLYPEDPNAPSAPIGPGVQVILDAELTPPPGLERIVALWSRQPLPLRWDQLLSHAGITDVTIPLPSCATRDIKRVKEVAQRLEPGDWSAVVLALDHRPVNGE